MLSHEIFMERCLQLAQLGLGAVAPNPMVGAVLVHNDTIVGEGYHEVYGGTHAEVNALQHVPDEIVKQSTLYVSLEPCSHYGKTPPCANLILSKKIPKVVVAMRDPNPLVSGRGIALLREHGVTVTEGVLESQAKFLNRRFLTFHTKKRPYIILKWAQTADGFIAGNNNATVKITGSLSQTLSHQWRTEESAIMVGTQTVLADNPALTARYVKGKNPLRITFDRERRLSGYRIADGSAPSLFFTYTDAISKVNAHEYVVISDGESRLTEVLHVLYHKNILSIIVEGGATLLQSFVNADLWDEARVFTNNRMLLHDGLPAPVLNFNHAVLEHLENDSLKLIYNQ